MGGKVVRKVMDSERNSLLWEGREIQAPRILWVPYSRLQKLNSEAPEVIGGLTSGLEMPHGLKARVFQIVQRIRIPCKLFKWQMYRLLPRPAESESLQQAMDFLGKALSGSGCICVKWA